MAFPVSEHLPRKQISANVSSTILSKISDVTNKTLSAAKAAEWVSELEASIQQTNDRIYERINDELPDFERQLESSRSVQTRLHDLSSNVDRLAETLEDPRTGLLPTLQTTLKAHKELAQRASDAEVTYEALSYLNECCIHFESLSALVKDGNLTEGITEANKLSALLDNAPEALARASVTRDMRNQLRTLKDRIEEQLSEAYSRSVRISSTEFRICPSVKVRQSQTIISLRDILSSLSSTSLGSHLASLRRDIVSHYIDFPLQQPSSADISETTDPDGAPSICFSIFPLPPSPTTRNSIPAYLRSLFDFLREHLFPVLPASAASSFPQSLYKPTSSALLRDAIVPSVPSSLTRLPSFLELVQDSTEFEKEYFFKSDSTTDNLHGEGEILVWARGVAGHYGRKRRIDLLAEARKIILSPEDGRTFRAETTATSGANMTPNVPEVVPVQGGIDGGEEPENGWDFDVDAPNTDAQAAVNGNRAGGVGKRSFEQSEADEANGRDFIGVNVHDSEKTRVDDDAQDDSDAWGWGDEEGNSTPATSENDNLSEPTEAANGHQVDESRSQENSEDAAWDSAWDEPEPIPPSPPVQPVSPPKVPKVAKRLEKLTMKGKGKGPTSPTLSSNPPSSTFSTSSTFPSNTSAASQSNSPRSHFASSATSPVQNNPQTSSGFQSGSIKPPALSLSQKPKKPETYLVSGRVQDLLRLISDILSEGRAIAVSSIFSDFPLLSSESSSGAGTFVLQATPASLDLYRAIYPIAFSLDLARSSRALRFANDCLYLHEEVAKLTPALPPAATTAPVHEQMREALERLHALGAWWSDEGIERQCQRVLQILSRAEGFVDTSDQERFDECEAVMSEVLRDVRTVTTEWKTILPRTKWLRAAGRVVETALTRVLGDVLALPDIPEVDSRRLSELCRILNAIEGLFVDTEDPEASSVVLDYVPSWLKYSYLSELLEASIADIMYLFGEGALIDFTVDELVRLVRALFADTPVRTNAIAQMQRGHPVPTE